MAFQTVFKRYEMKYMLALEQREKVLAAMAPYMELDKYGRTTIRNIYYDTDTYLLIRRSMEKPAYKEKLRIRSYSKAEPDSTVFVELKKKYNHVVYKRRISLPEEEAMEWIAGEHSCHKHTQISEEVDCFIHYSGIFDDIFKEYTTSHDLARVKSTNMGSMFKLTYNVALRDVTKEKEMIDKLCCRNGNLEITVSKQESSHAEL